MKLGPFSHIGSLAPSRGHKIMGSLPFFKTFLLIRLTSFVHACHDKFCWPSTLQIMIFAYFRVPYVMKIFAISKMSPTLKCTNFLAIIMQKLVRFDWFFWFLWFFIWPPLFWKHVFKNAFIINFKVQGSSINNNERSCGGINVLGKNIFNIP